MAHARTHECNERAFETDSAESRYWAGFFMADGCVHTRRGELSGISLGLSAKDAEHVESFRRFLGSSHPVRVQSAPQLYPKATIQISSRTLAASLHRYGITPRKTFCAAIPSWLADDRDFWRGMVDGDGWLLCYPRRSDGRGVSLGLTGTKPVCRSFAAYAESVIGPPSTMKHFSVNPNGRRGVVWRVDIHGRQAADLAAHLYGGPCEALPRKRDTVPAMAALVGERSRVVAERSTARANDRRLRHGKPCAKPHCPRSGGFGASRNICKTCYIKDWKAARKAAASLRSN